MVTLRFQSGATRWTVDTVLVSPQEANDSATNAPLVQFDKGATGNTLINSHLRYANDATAATWGNDDWVNNSGTAIYVIGSDNTIAKNNIRNSRNGVMLERASAAGDGATGATVRDNRVEHFWEDAFRTKVSDGTFEYNAAVNSYAVVPPGMEGDPPHRDMFQSYRGDASHLAISNVTLRRNVFISRQGEARYTKVPFQVGSTYTIQGISCFDGPYEGWTIENNLVLVEVGLAMSLYGMNDSKIYNNTIIPSPWNEKGDSQIRLWPAKPKDGGKPSDNNFFARNLSHKIDTKVATRLHDENNRSVASNYEELFVNYAKYDMHLKSGDNVGIVDHVGPR